MKSIATFLFFLLLVPGLNYAQTKLKAGDKAPDFTAKDQDGKTVSLSQFKGKKVILYFYPKDFTAGCTAEACNLRDNMTALAKDGYYVLGVSTDDEASHKKFQTEHNLPFPLLADVDKTVHNKYGVWVERERNGVKSWSTVRTTFLINKDGFINKVIENVDTKDHTTQILGLK
jgi:thioredoxin-dependent peroxiredoxin